MPEGAQLSARLPEHVAQAAPGAPQVEVVSAVQVSPAQQPEGHDAASHWQPVAPQLWPAPHWASLPHRHAPLLEHAFAFAMSHVEHDAPVAPHAAALVGALQPPSAPQQPPPQDVESQTHALFTHTELAAHN